MIVKVQPSHTHKNYVVVFNKERTIEDRGCDKWLWRYAQKKIRELFVPVPVLYFIAHLQDDRIVLDRVVHKNRWPKW